MTIAIELGKTPFNKAFKYVARIGGDVPVEPPFVEHWSQSSLYTWSTYLNICVLRGFQDFFTTSRQSQKKCFQLFWTPIMETSTDLLNNLL